MKLVLISFLFGSLPLFANPPAPPTLAQREAALLQRFDTDGDGILSPEERAAAARVLRAETAAQNQARTAAIQAREEAGQSKRDVALLRRFDVDGDGVLSPQERRVAEETIRREREAFSTERKRP
jgi:hypothetical protein